jgi:spore germination protein YaaH
VIPSISNYVGGRWDGRMMARVLSDPALRARHARAIVAAVTEHGWDGVDVDYESLPAAARDSFSVFVSELSEKLHAAGAVLTVTVQAKTSAGQGSTGSQDWAAIGRAADRVRVMAYDHAWATSRPGSVAPLPWVDRVLTFAVREIPVKKVELGIAAYGYDWSGQSGTSVSWQHARALAVGHGATVHWEPTNGSVWFSYANAAGPHHVVWFEDARSARLKIAAARRHGVTHVVVWQLGGADPRLWHVLSAGQ